MGRRFKKLEGPPHEILEKEKVLCPSSTAVDTLRPHKHPHPRYPKKESWGKIKRKDPKMNWVLVGFLNTTSCRRMMTSCVRWDSLPMVLCSTGQWFFIHLHSSYICAPLIYSHLFTNTFFLRKASHLQSCPTPLSLLSLHFQVCWWASTLYELFSHLVKNVRNIWLKGMK